MSLSRSPPASAEAIARALNGRSGDGWSARSPAHINHRLATTSIQIQGAAALAWPCREGQRECQAKIAP
jgi:hypothetical protein